MLGPLAIVAPFVMAAVLIASAIGKLRHPDDLAGWSEIGVPKPLRKEWIRRAHPWLTRSRCRSRGARRHPGAARRAGRARIDGRLPLAGVARRRASRRRVVRMLRRAQARDESDRGAQCVADGRRRPDRRRDLDEPDLRARAAAALSAWLWLLAAAIAVVTALFVAGRRATTSGQRPLRRCTSRARTTTKSWTTSGPARPPCPSPSPTGRRSTCALWPSGAPFLCCRSRPPAAAASR